MNLTTKVIHVLLVFLFTIACTKDKKIEENPPPNTNSIGIEILAHNLQIPWGLAFLPNGDFIFTERSGKFNLLKKNEHEYNTLMVRVVQTYGEGGLLGIAVDPLFDSNHFIYIYETTDSNRVLRFRLENGSITKDKTIVTGIPQSPNHNGGGLKFGPDGYLYIGTGDALNPSRAQDKNSLAGKILRVDREGLPPPGNPFGNLIWSYGHRNVQGFSWTSNGKMLATEHGPSIEFGWCCHDEINLILPGKNYGWPLTYGGAEKDSLTPALFQSGDDTWAPSGCTYLGAQSHWPNCLLVGCLRGQRLICFFLNATGDAVVATKDTLSGQFNRLRNVVEAPDGSVVFCTSNLGTINPPQAGDDKICRIFFK